MLKNIFNLILKIIIILFILLFFFAVVRPAYINYKLNKKEVIIDKSGELAIPKMIEAEIQKNEKNKSGNSNNDDNENAWKLEKKENYDPFTFDDRILLYEGNINSDSMNKLMDILIEDIESATFSKPDITINGADITYSDKDTYSSSLINFKTSISESDDYTVNFEYNSIRTVVNKIIITKNS